MSNIVQKEHISYYIPDEIFYQYFGEWHLFTPEFDIFRGKKAHEKSHRNKITSSVLYILFKFFIGIKIWTKQKQSKSMY